MRREKMMARIDWYGVVNKKVLMAMRRIDRMEFVPGEQEPAAYEDTPLPIGYEQTISQPYTVARMIELLIEEASFEPEKSRVLEIGTGSGYQTAILSMLFGEVYSVEVIAELSKRAGETLSRLGITNCRLRVGDGKEGWKEHGPYAAVIVAANAQAVPMALLEQMKEGGRIVIPVWGMMLRGTKGPNEAVSWGSFGNYRFVPLV